MNKAFGNDTPQKKFVSDMDQALNKMIDTPEKIKMKKTIDNEQKVRGLVQ